MVILGVIWGVIQGLYRILYRGYIGILYFLSGESIYSPLPKRDKHKKELHGSPLVEF